MLSNLPYHRYVNAFTGWYVRGNSPILISQILSPLRYDIIIRSDFFTFLKNNLDVYKYDFGQFLSKVKLTEYFVWFRDVVCFRSRRYLRNNPTELNRAFESRVRQSASLYLAFEKHGFDSRFPITLRTGSKILSSTSGIRLGGPVFFAGDGCHRIALLHLAGQKFLYCNQYIIRKSLFYIPLDNTDILIRSLSMSKARYFDFLAMWIEQRPGLDGKSLLLCAEQLDPGKRDVLIQLIQRHSAILGSSCDGY